jgi:hypothetical protein
MSYIECGTEEIEWDVLTELHKDWRLNGFSQIARDRLLQVARATRITPLTVRYPWDRSAMSPTPQSTSCREVMSVTVEMFLCDRPVLRII